MCVNSGISKDLAIYTPFSKPTIIEENAGTDL